MVQVHELHKIKLVGKETTENQRLLWWCSQMEASTVHLLAK